MEQIKVDTRQTRQAIEEDVRSAKARGLLEQSWPPREPLPQSVAADLAEARALFGREMAQYEAIEVGTGAPIDVGQIGKAIPHA